MRPCDTCGRPTTDANSHCDHAGLKLKNEWLRAQLAEYEGIECVCVESADGHPGQVPLGDAVRTLAALRAQLATTKRQRNDFKAKYEDAAALLNDREQGCEILGEKLAEAQASRWVLAGERNAVTTQRDLLLDQLAEAREDFHQRNHNVILLDDHKQLMEEQREECAAQLAEAQAREPWGWQCPREGCFSPYLTFGRSGGLRCGNGHPLEFAARACEESNS